jgi:DNA-binding transcriptional ArsR family regulator
MIIRRDVFQAIADPTRREIVGLLAKSRLNVNAVAEKFDMTRQAISLHVKILEECGLIVIRQEGRERICEAKLESLREVFRWTEQYRQYWESHLDSLERYLTTIQKKKSHGLRKRKK